MSKNTKSFLLDYVIVAICLMLLLQMSDSMIENKDLFRFSGIIICLSTLFLGYLVSINHFLRKIANSQTKDKNHDS